MYGSSTKTQELPKDRAISYVSIQSESDNAFSTKIADFHRRNKKVKNQSNLVSLMSPSKGPSSQLYSEIESSIQNTAQIEQESAES